ncbi:MAG TPA: 50S ribosomal protein L4 [Fimbriimonadaceae bacterium]|nr:50S ribosomal protein L4 [Fimbriimonadaceae bacterium]
MANTIEIKGKDGKVVGKHSLSEKLTEATASPATLHRTVVAEEANKRQGTQKTKTRSEVRGGGRKPYKQKKTGNARQGTIRAPHYAHGGMALALEPRDYSKKVNKKERRNAILTAFAAHLEAGNVTVADSLTFAEAKTKQAHDLLKAHGLDDVRRVLVVLPAYDEASYKSFRNIKNVTVRTAPAASQDEKQQAFSARDVLVAHKILIAKDALAKIEEVWAK